MSNETKEVGRSRLFLLGQTLVGAVAGGFMSVIAIYGCFFLAELALFLAPLFLTEGHIMDRGWLTGYILDTGWFPASLFDAYNVYATGLGLVTEPNSESEQLIATLTLIAVVVGGSMAGALLGYKQRRMPEIPQSEPEE